MTAIPGPSGAEPGESRALAGYPVTPPALPRPVIFDQRWTDLTFIHWPVLPESVAGSYPPGTRPDVFADGMTYVGLVPFRMSSTKLGTEPPRHVRRLQFLERMGSCPAPYTHLTRRTNREC